jgi:hypothetical protein
MRLNMARADAYVGLYPFLSKATVPRGVGDLAVKTIEIVMVRCCGA